MPTNPETQTDQRPHVLIVAYSGRSLAHAAKAAGLHVTVADQFGDHDTQQIADEIVRLNFQTGRARAKMQATCEPLGKLFRRTRTILGDLPPISGVLLGGGCENRPGVIREIQLLAGETALWGLPCPTKLEQLRDRQFYRSAAEHAGCGFPTSMSVKSFSADQRRMDKRVWLLKAPDSAGGLGVRYFSRGQLIPSNQRSRQYCQLKIPGRQLGVTLIAGPSGTHLAGCTESISHRDWQPPSAPPNLGEFLYRGSWGPIELTGHQEKHVLRLGDYCASQTGWQGWLQADFIEDSNGQLWLLEINPRWTAGMEVLHRAGACNPVEEHLKALGIPVPAVYGEHGTSSVCAKVVWYADRNSTAKHFNAAALRAQAELDAQSECQATRFVFCDIPPPCGEPIVIGHPGLTIIANQRLGQSASCTSRQRQQLLSELDKARNILRHHLEEGT